MEWFTIDPCEYQVVVFPTGTEKDSVFELSAPVPSQNCDSRGIELDRSTAAVGLWATDLDLVFHSDDCLND